MENDEYAEGSIFARFWQQPGASPALVKKQLYAVYSRKIFCCYTKKSSAVDHGSLSEKTPLMIKKNLLSFAGGSLGLMGMIFVAIRINDYSSEINLFRFTSGEWLLILMATFFYCAANILLARAWWNILRSYQSPATFRWAVVVYGLSQLAKYIPGNIMHIAGRQTLGMHAGIPAGILVKSALWEIGLFVFAGSLFSLMILPLIYSDFSIVFWATAFILTTVAAWKITGFYSHDLGAAFAWAILFLIISGIIFTLIFMLSSASSIANQYVPAICGAYVTAWLAGLLTPGAPAGAGVREIVLLFLLGGITLEADLLLAVLIGRVVTVLGDFFFYILAFTVKLTKPV